MDPVLISDGVDGPETVAFGLGASQVGVLVLCLFTGYAVLHTPLPGWCTVMLAALCGVLGAALAWGRHAGRPLLEWAVLAVHFLWRRQRARASRHGHGRQRGAVVVPMALRRHDRGSASAAFDPSPAQRPRVLEAVATGARPSPEERPFFAGAPRRITFFSLNGGSGRTTLATEVSCLLAAQGRHHPSGAERAQPLQVALLDLDVRAASVALRLGIDQPVDWERVLLAPARCVAADGCMVTHTSGLRVLPGPPQPLPADAVEPDRLDDLLRAVEASGVHYVVLDCAADLGPVSRWALDAAHDVYMVVIPTAAGLLHTYRATAALRRHGLRHKLRYVVNRSSGSADLDEVMADLDGGVVADIPEDRRLIDAENTHRLAALELGGPAAMALTALAARIYPGMARELEPPLWQDLARHAG